MAAFSYQHHQSLFLDPAYLPSNPIHMAPAPQQPGDLTNNSSSPFFPCHYSPDAMTEISTNDVRAYESSSSLDTTTRITSSDHHKVKLVKEVPTTQNSMDKKRKNNKQMVSSTSAVSNEGKRTKQKKCGIGMKDAEKRPVSDEGEEKQKQQPPTGYIHVRARRGQATDSHSLAERVRREKISERMKLLQGLVPGCDQVIGKALMLDEIINYVQSLQNQVEFLSMKLASVSPTLYEFGLDLDDYMIQAQKMEGMPPPVPSVQQTAHIQPTAFEETTDNYPMVDTSVPFLLHGQGPSAHSQEQDSFAMHVDGQSQRFLHQFQFNNMCPFL